MSESIEEKEKEKIIFFCMDERTIISSQKLNSSV